MTTNLRTRLAELRDKMAEEKVNAHPYLEGLDGSDLYKAYQAGFDALADQIEGLVSALIEVRKINWSDIPTADRFPDQLLADEAIASFEAFLKGGRDG
jgi:hypothetical protein